MPLYNIECTVTHRPRITVEAPNANLARSGASQYLAQFATPDADIKVNEAHDITPIAPFSKVVAVVDKEGKIEVTA